MSTSHDAASLAADIAQRCAGASLHGNYWKACCPAHDDHSPSLSIASTEDKVLLKCHTGCPPDAIVAALGLTMADLYLQQPHPANGHKRIVEIYDYHDATGHVRHQTVRFAPKAFRQRRPDPARPGEYLWNLQGIEPVLYNLPAVLQARGLGEPIHLAEGEKDARTLIALGLVATTVPMGAKYWRDSYTETLTGADVVVWPDNDAAGQASVAKVTAKLAGKATRLRVVTVPRPHKDVSDWIHAGGTRADVDAMVLAAPPPAPPATRDTGGVPVSTGSDPPLPLSNYTNALAFVRDHGEDVRYCEAWKKWLHWTGTHWSAKAQGPIFQRAKATIKQLLLRADPSDDDEYRAWLTHIKRSLSTAALKAMVESAQNEPGVTVCYEALNQRPWLLPCLNGTLDLKTGRLTPHAREDLLTECLAIPYDATATCPRWQRFLWQIMGGSHGDDTPEMRVGELEARGQADARARLLIAFVQRLLGMALTGDVREQDLYVFYGTGANGKSTLMGIVLHILGHYGMKAAPELLMASKDHDRHPTERADLFGKRLVAAIETEQGRRLNETLVKELTGGDPIRARRMREDFWEFLPSHKIILATNHKPEIRGTDHAIWRRIKLIPFTVTIPDAEQDPALPEKLLEEVPGIFAWMVRGCLDWHQHGLGTPDAVVTATATYRDEMDDLQQFLAEVCFTGKDHYKASASALLKAYHQWSGQTTETAKAFAKKLHERGFTSKREGTGMFWLRIGLPADPEAHM
jgi:putative DNA primase/helicase